jgi:excisionase family DNA binding protein
MTQIDDDRAPLMTLNELARFLHVGEKTVLKLARDKKIPAARIGDELRFRRADIDAWLEKQLHGEDAAELADVPDGMRLPLADLIPDEALIHDMRATEPLSAIEELAARAWANNWLTDKPWFVGAVVEREALSSTAMEGGVAFLHTRARDASKIARPFMIVGRSYDGIDFGAPDGRPTYLFFMLGLKYDRLHLPILGRLARIMVRDPRTVARLRATTSPTKMRHILLKLDANELKSAVPSVLEVRRSSPVLDKDLRLRAIMRVQARRKHEEKKETEARKKAEVKAKANKATTEKRQELAAKKAAAAEARKEKAAQAAAKKEAAAKKKREAAAKKREAAAKKKEAAANKKREAAAKKKEAAAKKKKSAAASKKKSEAARPKAKKAASARRPKRKS